MTHGWGLPKQASPTCVSASRLGGDRPLQTAVAVLVNTAQNRERTHSLMPPGTGSAPRHPPGTTKHAPHTQRAPHKGQKTEKTW